LNAPDNLNYEFGPFLLDPRARRLSRDGQVVSLAAPEFELLLLLVRNRGRIVEKREIMDAVWPDAVVEENNLTVRMSSLRRALGETKGHHPYIQTVTGRGYCLTVPVKELPAYAGSATTATPEREWLSGVTPGPETKAEQVIGSTVAVSPGGAISSATKRRHRQLRGYRLYTFVGVVVMAISVVYGVVIRWRRSDNSPAEIQSMKMSRVTHSGRIMYAAVSPDGQNIAYVDRDGELSSLWLQRTRTNNPLQLLPPAKLLYKELAFSPDGATLYYSKCLPSCKLHKMPVLGGVETALPVRADSPVTFAPDGKRMGYMRVAAVGKETEVSLLVAKPDGTGEEALKTWPGGSTYQYGAPAWSPDGKTIAVSLLVDEGGRKYMTVAGINVADRKESRLSSQRWRYIKDVVWLPDGSGLIINARDEGSSPELAVQIWRVPVGGGEARRITNDLNNYMRIALSADGQTLTAMQTQWTSGLWITPTDNSSAPTQVTRGTLDRQDGSLGVAVGPDDRLVYVSMLSGKKDLWSINADGSGIEQLTDGPHSDGDPAVTPDGRYIVFESSRDGARNIWRVDADGRNPTRLTRGRYDSEPECSRDGQWVVYVANDDGRLPRLRKVPIGGGESTALTNEFAQHPSFSPDGKVLAYYRMDQEHRERRDLIFIPAQGGAPINTIPAPKNFGSVMRWSPAGDAISYRDNTLSAIWRQPIDGTPPSILMDLRGQQLFSFCYSQDGRRLAYAAGPSLSDVILITGFN
jgi:Tol biopolymer transport system component/DNA-binding winged helix-turn-helix (wHTH) protein